MTNEVIEIASKTALGTGVAAWASEASAILSVGVAIMTIIYLAVGTVKMIRGMKGRQIEKDSVEG